MKQYTAYLANGQEKKTEVLLSLAQTTKEKILSVTPNGGFETENEVFEVYDASSLNLRIRKVDFLWIDETLPYMNVREYKQFAKDESQLYITTI